MCHSDTVHTIYEALCEGNDVRSDPCGDIM